MTALRTASEAEVPYTAEKADHMTEIVRAAIKRTMGILGTGMRGMGGPDTAIRETTGTIETKAAIEEVVTTTVTVQKEGERQVEPLHSSSRADYH
jgi:hypothetical protein